MKTRKIPVWELLAVIVIILFVAAVLFPVFAKARSHDHHASCMSNEKQIGLSLAQYVQDNDEFMPNISDTPGSANTWRRAIFPYIKSNSVFQCPERAEDSSKALGPDGLPRSYAANYSGNDRGGVSDMGQGAFAGPGSRHVAIADMKQPATLIEICEVEGSNAPEFNIDDDFHFGPNRHVLWAGHENQTNFLFADGHVKLLQPTKTASYQAPGGYGTPVYINLWYRDNTKPLSATGAATLAEAEKRGAASP